jgi:exodeoxyribonuclease V alpha subunit
MIRSRPFQWDDFLGRLFPETGAALRRLLASAANSANLVPTDFYTLRDLLDLSGYSGHEPLYALLLVLLVALDEGSVCIEASAEGLSRRLRDLVDDAAEARRWARRIAAHLHGPGYAELIGDRGDDGLPLVRRRIADRTYLYFQRYFTHEGLLREALRTRLEAGTSVLPPHQLAAVLEEVLVYRPVVLDGRRLVLNRDQRLAVGSALLHTFLVISGGPGTGKTSIIFTLLRCLVRCGISPERITLAAPTGRAAQRMTDAIRLGLDQIQPPAGASGPDATLAHLAGQTLHHVLGYHPGRGTFRHHRENPLPADVIIVDEVSMVGLVLMSQLFQATAGRAKLILLGDRDQLPPAEAGAVLASLTPSAGRPGFSVTQRDRLAELFDDLRDLPVGKGGPLEDALVFLDQNYRSQPELAAVARQINAQDTEVVERIPTLALPGKAASPGPPGRGQGTGGPRSWLVERTGCWLLDQPHGDGEAWRRLLHEWAACHYLSDYPDAPSYAALIARLEITDPDELTPNEQSLLDQLFLLHSRARILTMLREGPWGAVGVNRFLEQHLRPRLDQGSGDGLFAGAVVLITRNDCDYLLFNGDVGVTVRTSGGAYQVAFPQPGGYSLHPPESLPDYELGFALTVHKSQGSEYSRVLLVLPPEGGRQLLTRELVYTGITRARELAVICGNKEALRFAVSRRTERESTLMDFDFPTTWGGKPDRHVTAS